MLVPRGFDCCARAFWADSHTGGKERLPNITVRRPPFLRVARGLQGRGEERQGRRCGGLLTGRPFGSAWPLFIKSLFVGGMDLSFRKCLFPSLLTGKKGCGGAGSGSPWVPDLG